MSLIKSEQKSSPVELGTKLRGKKTKKIETRCPSRMLKKDKILLASVD